MMFVSDDRIVSISNDLDIHTDRYIKISFEDERNVLVVHVTTAEARVLEEKLSEYLVQEEQ